MTITVSQIQILNNKLGGWARRVQLGTIIDNAEKAIVAGVAAGGITATEMAANAVETAAIKAKNVTTAKIADEAVTAVQIASATITGEKIAVPTSATTHVKRALLGVFDATLGKVIGTHAIAVALPSKAIVTRVDYEVVTTFTSATDAGTIALTLQGAGDVVAAVSIVAATDWDASVPVVTKVDGTTAKYIKCTAARTLSAVVAVEALTAGVLRVYAEYVESV